MNKKLDSQDLNRPSLEEYTQLSKRPICLVLDNVRSAQNVGSVFRTMDAFACEKLLLCGITPCPPHKEINKTALGATNSVTWQKFDHTADAVQELKTSGWLVYAIEQATNRTWLDELQLERKQKIAFVFGNEVSGVDQAVIDECDGVLEIRQHGTKHSLNIAVCTGIVLWHTTKGNITEK